MNEALQSHSNYHAHYTAYIIIIATVYNTGNTSTIIGPDYVINASVRFLVNSVLCGQRSVSRIKGRGGLLSLTGEDSEPSRVVSVELVVEEDAEVMSEYKY